METVLYIIHILVCIAMLPIILLQSGKGGGVSAVFGGGGAGTVFGSRGASNFLTKMTTGAAVVFMLTSMGLSYYSSQSKSVVGDAPKPTTGTTEVGTDDQAAPPADMPAPGTQVPVPIPAPADTPEGTPAEKPAEAPAPAPKPEG